MTEQSGEMPASQPAIEQQPTEGQQDFPLGLERIDELFDMTLRRDDQTELDRQEEVINNLLNPEIRQRVALMYGIEDPVRLDERLQDLATNPEAVRELARMTLAQAEQDRRLYEMGFDGLTGLLRADTFWAKLTRRFARGDVRTHEKLILPDGTETWPMLVLFADGDKFGRINKTHDHLIGNRAIQGIARIFGGNFRAEDFAARYGGDEFVGVKFGLTSRRAGEVADRLVTDMARGVRFQTDYGEGVCFTATAASDYGKDVRTFADAQQLIASASQKVVEQKRIRDAEG